MESVTISWNGNIFSGISTDTRTYTNEELFVAIAGENFDGLDHIEKILKKNVNTVKAIVFNNNEKNKKREGLLKNDYPQITFFPVKDSILFLQELAKNHLASWRKLSHTNSVIAITGSNGKTTTKEMLIHLFEAIYPEKVLATRGNLNNHLGVPMTLLRLTPEHQIAIIEMGSNHPGEIATLCEIAHPNSGIITNIGAAHLEFFKNEEGVFKEKSALYFSLFNEKDAKFFITSKDDKYLAKLSPFPGFFFFSESDENSDWKIKFITNNLATLENKKLAVKVKILNENITEKHNFKNLISAFILTYSYSPTSREKIVKACQTFSSPKNNRSMWITVNNNLKIFLDAYNANPSSMQASLISFCEKALHDKIALSDCACVLGDMNELGEKTEEFHMEIGKFLLKLGITNAFFIGKYANFYKKGSGLKGKAFEQKSDFIQGWELIKKSYRYILIKGSRSLQLESLVTDYTLDH